MKLAALLLFIPACGAPPKPVVVAPPIAIDADAEIDIEDPKCLEFWDDPFLDLDCGPPVMFSPDPMTAPGRGGCLPP